MRKMIITLLLVAIVAAVALPAGVLAKPTVENIQLRIPLAGRYDDLPEPCEDLVHLSGTLHVTVHLTEMENGDRLLVVHTNPQAAVTQGVETGNIYRGVGVGHRVERTLGPGESYTSVDVFLQVPEFGLQYVVHTTVNANGELTAEIDHFIEPGFSCADLSS